MGFFSFLKKKKEEPSVLGMEPLKLDWGKPPVETVRPSPYAPVTPEVPSFELPKPFPEPTAFREVGAPKEFSRDIDLLSSKLDTIKAMLENLSHRLERLEQQQQQQAKDRLRW